MATVICRNDISPFRLGVAGVYYAKPSENIDCSKQKFSRKICAFCWKDFLSDPEKPEKIQIFAGRDKAGGKVTPSYLSYAGFHKEIWAWFYIFSTKRIVSRKQSIKWLDCSG